MVQSRHSFRVVDPSMIYLLFIEKATAFHSLYLAPWSTPRSIMNELQVMDVHIDRPAALRQWPPQSRVNQANIVRPRGASSELRKDRFSTRDLAVQC